MEYVKFSFLKEVRSL